MMIKRPIASEIMARAIIAIPIGCPTIKENPFGSDEAKIPPMANGMAAIV